MAILWWAAKNSLRGTVLQTRLGATRAPVVQTHPGAAQVQTRPESAQAPFVQTSSGAAQAPVVQTRPGSAQAPFVQASPGAAQAPVEQTTPGAPKDYVVQTRTGAAQASTVQTCPDQHRLMLSRHILCTVDTPRCSSGPNGVDISRPAQAPVIQTFPWVQLRTLFCWHVQVQQRPLYFRHIQVQTSTDSCCPDRFRCSPGPCVA